MSVRGENTCAVTTGGAAQCWGDDFFGQVGTPMFANSDVPVAVSGLSSGVSAIDTGGEDTCALTTAGDVLCWGDNNNAELGDGGTSFNSPVPIALQGLPSP